MSTVDRKDGPHNTQSPSNNEEQGSTSFNLDYTTPSKNANHHKGIESLTDTKSFMQYLSISSIDSNFEQDAYTQPHPTYFKNGTVNKPTESNVQRSMFSREAEDKDKLQELNPLRMERLTSLLELTVMAHVKAAKTSEFSIDNWAKLQDMLKSNYLLVKSELQFKEKLRAEIDALMIKYNTLYLKNKENSDRIRKRLEKDEFREEDIARVLFTAENDGLGNASLFVKKLLFTMYEKPKVITIIVKNSNDQTSLRALEETFCNTFFEDLITIEAHDHNVLRLLKELLEVEFERAKKPSDLFRTENFATKVLTSYLRRNEYKKYTKLILKMPLLLCVRETKKIRFDPQDIERRLKKSKEAQPTTPVLKKQTEGRPRFNTDSDLKMMMGRHNFLTEVTSRGAVATETVKDQYIVPKFKKKEASRKASTDMSLHNLESRVSNESDDAFEMMIYEDTKQKPMEKIKNLEVIQILEENFATVKKHLGVLIQSIFDNLYLMPVGLRVLSKLILRLAQTKFPGLAEREYNEILGNYIFRKWIIPNFMFPEHNGILSDLHLSKEETSYNLMEIVKVIQVIFSQTRFPENDIKSELNAYIDQILPSVAEYYHELVAVNENIEENVLHADVNAPRRVTARSICISMYEINAVCDGIIRNKQELMGISPECINLAEKIQFLDKEGKLFVERTNPATSQPLKTAQIYLLFTDLMFPPGFVPDYIAEFDKLCSYSKDASKKDKLVAKAKHILKQILLETDDIGELKYTSVDGCITLDDVLRSCQNKLSFSSSKNAERDNKASLDLSAKFLETLLNRLDQDYGCENYKLLYAEMSNDFEKVAQQLDVVMSRSKLQLLKGLEALRKRYATLELLNEKKRKALKKSFVREFIRMIKIPLCVTSPSTMKALASEEQAQQKNSQKKSTTIPDKITLVLKNEEGCIHEKFAIARELASNSIMTGKAQSKSASDKALKKEAELKDDIFNENNYHCETIDEFIQIFGGLFEVKDAIITGRDNYGVAEALAFYYDKINAGAKIGFKNVVEDEYGLILDEIENYITKRLYSSVFPASETQQDLEFYYRCKSLEWVDFDHLEIAEENRCEEMWIQAAHTLNEMDSKTTSVGKLENVVECFKTITKVMQLASLKEGSIGADDTLPVMIYVLLKACPRRLHTNFNFVSFLRDEGKMLAGEGYCFIQLKSAAMTIEAMDSGFLRMSEEKFNSNVQMKKIEHGISTRRMTM